MSLKQFFHLPAMSAAFASVLIGCRSSAVVIFQAAGAAFWALVAGASAPFVFRYKS